jgi:hypothetical protein
MNLIVNFESTYDSFKKRIELGFSFIPASIRYDRYLNDTSKIIYSVLVMLNNTYEYVYVSNDYLSRLLSIPNSTIRDNLSKLKKYSYIDIFDSSLNRYIKVRKDDLPKYKHKINIDVSTLDHESLSSYYALIPGIVLLSENINSTEKILYSELMSLTNKFGFAFISNQKLSSIMDLSERQLIRCLNNLIKFNFIKYGKDLKSKRIIYVSNHFKKDFEFIDNPKYKYQVFEDLNNKNITIKSSLNVLKYDDQIEKVLDDFYTKI